jgi:hypothetical protein
VLFEGNDVIHSKCPVGEIGIIDRDTKTCLYDVYRIIYEHVSKLFIAVSEHDL